MRVMDAIEFRMNLISVLDDAIENDNPVTIHASKGNAVILSERNYDGIFETISILSQRKQYKRIKEGEKEDTSQ